MDVLNKTPRHCTAKCPSAQRSQEPHALSPPISKDVAMTPENQCSEKIWPTGGYNSYPCPNRARFKHDNLWFCGRHNPDSVAERRRKQAEKNEPKVKARAAKFRLERAAPDLKAVAEMVLATATIETPKELVNAARAAVAKAEGR